MGDIITEDLHLPINNPKQFLTILENVKQMDIETVVPGHGEVGTLALGETSTNYLSFLIKKVMDAQQNNVSLSDFISEFIMPIEYANWKGVNGITRNLTTVYNFYAGKLE